MDKCVITARPVLSLNKRACFGCTSILVIVSRPLICQFIHNRDKCNHLITFTRDSESIKKPDSWERLTSVIVFWIKRITENPKASLAYKIKISTRLISLCWEPHNQALQKCHNKTSVTYPQISHYLTITLTDLFYLMYYLFIYLFLSRGLWLFRIEKVLAKSSVLCKLRQYHQLEFCCVLFFRELELMFYL